jgi:DnaJ-domain-containing protein 1
MFSKTDPANNLRSFRVTLKLRSGESEAGAILVPAHRTLRETLNDDAPFIELETQSGRQSFVLKTEIARVDPQGAAEPRGAERAGLGEDATRFDANDARIVLGVAANATDEEIHAAWRDLAKAYHPDRLTALGLPNEILRHADRVLARINAAFQRLRNDASARSA